MGCGSSTPTRQGSPVVTSRPSRRDLSIAAATTTYGLDRHLGSPTSPQLAPSPKKTAFSFNPLPHNDSIRLLILEPAADLTAPLQASLQHVQQGSEPRYEAISYTWGTDSPSPSLYLDGAFMNIVPNLDSALRRFRSSYAPRTLWADQICINQSDSKEKSHQVVQMARIYRSAQKVLIWLGEEDGNTQQAFKDLISVGDGPAFMGVDWNQMNQFWWNGAPTLKRSNTDESLTKYLEMARSTGVKNVYGRDWFSRLWTVQEVVLAREAVLHCGPHQMTWNTFGCATEFLRAAQNEKRLLDDAASDLLERAGVIADIRYHHGDINDVRPDMILNHYQHFGIYMSMLRRQSCSNDRDRVYALLGLRPYIYDQLEEQGVDANFKIDVDYNKEPFTIYREWAVEMMGNGDVNFILDAGLWQRDLVVWVDGMIFHNRDPKWKKGCWAAEDEEGEAAKHDDNLVRMRRVNEAALAKWQIVPQLQHLPSWVPDLSDSSKKLTTAPWINPCMMGGDGFKARSTIDTGGCAIQHVQWESGFERGGEAPRRIFVKALRLDTVGSKQTMHEWTDSDPVSHSEYLRKIVSTCSALFHNVLFADLWPVREDMFTVFARTLLADGSGPTCRSLLNRMRKASKAQEKRAAPGVRPYTDTDRLVDLMATHVSWKERFSESPSVPVWPSDMFAGMKTACGGTREGSLRIDPSSPRYAAVMPDKQEIDKCLSETLEGHTFFISSKLNYIGLAPLMVKAGDVIALVDSVHVPVILRHAAGSVEGFMLLGPCYVHGVMHGETADREGECIPLI